MYLFNNKIKKAGLLTTCFIMAWFNAFCSIDLVQTTPAGEGACDGTITILADGTAGPYSAIITEISSGEEQYVFNIEGYFTIENLCAGAYEIEVSGLFGCEGYLYSTVPSCFSTTNITIQTVPASGGNGSVTIDIDPAVIGSFDFALYDADGFLESSNSTASNTITVNGLAIGEYCYTLEDNTPSVECAGQVVEACFVIQGSNCVLSLDFVPIDPIPAICSNSTTETIVMALVDVDECLENSMGDAIFTYEWSNGQTGPYPSGLTGGSHCVTLTPSNDASCPNCLFTTCIEVPVLDNAPIEFKSATVPECVTYYVHDDGDPNTIDWMSIYRNLGQIYIHSIAGGSGPYTVTWLDDGSHGVFRTGLKSGEYCAMIEDQCGNVVYECFNVGFYQGDKFCFSFAFVQESSRLFNGIPTSITARGNEIVVSSFATDKSEIGIEKLSANLNATNALSLASTEFIQPVDVKTLADGSVMVLSHFEGEVSGKTKTLVSQGREVLLSRYAADNSLQWLQTITHAGTGDAVKLAVDDTGNSYVVSNHVDGSTRTSMLTTLDPNGNIGQSIALTALTEVHDVQIANGVIAVLGKGLDSKSGEDILKVQSFTTNGSFQNTLDFGPTKASGKSELAFDANGIAAAHINDKGLLELIQVDLAGNISSNTFAADKIGLTDIVALGSGDYMLSGSFSGTLSVSSSQTLTSAGLRDIYFLQVDASGNILSAKQEGGAGDEYITALAAKDDGTVIYGGYYLQQADLEGNQRVQDFGTFTEQFSVGNKKKSVANSGLVKNEVTAEVLSNETTKLIAYPNPASDQLIVEFEAIDQKNVRIQLIDITGKVVLNKLVDGRSGSQRVFLEVSDFSNGMYELRIEGIGTTKIAILK